MSDDELRALERAVSDAPSRIRYADALARVGRGEDALRVLLAGIEEPSVRLAAARFSPRAAPIEKEPRLLWEYVETKEDTGALHANGFAVVVSVHNLSHTWPPYVGGAPESHEVHVLDPATGVRRARIPGFVCAGLVDEVLITANEPLDSESDDGLVVALDARGGSELWRLDGAGRGASVLVVGRRLVRRVFDRNARAWSAEAFSLDDPRRRPVERVAPVEAPDARSSIAQLGEWRYSVGVDVVLAHREKKEAWRFAAPGLTWDGHVVARGATLVVAGRRGGRVFCLG